MACSKEHKCFGNLVHSIHTCSCFFDVTRAALNKVEDVNDLWDIYEKFGLILRENLFWNHYKDCYMVCCTKHIDWLIATNYKNVFGKSSTECIEIPNKPYELCCLKYAKDLSDFCANCAGNLCDVLEENVYYVKTSK